MENYVIQHQLSLRPECVTCLVYHTKLHEQFVLKMIECKNETHANETFREAKNLDMIQHPYIGKLLETFVHFDKIKITFYLVIVMPFYRSGNFYQVLHTNWTHSRVTDEESLKKMLIQVLELLLIMNSYGISHLNLKPENIFYNSDTNNLILCDFGFKSIINDKRRYIRYKKSDILWISPVINASTDPSKIDIWTVGMILFSFMTTSVMSEARFFQLLQSSEKYDIKTLRNLLGNIYTDEFIQFTLLMLEPDNTLRPNIQEITAMNFYQQCFKVYSSQVISRKIRQRINTNMRPIPIVCPPKDLLQYICDENHNELCVEEALFRFQKMCYQNIINQLPSNYGKLITDSMEINNVNESICEYACNCLGYLSMHSNNPKEYTYSEPVIQAVIKTLELHPDSFRLYRYAAAYFIVLSTFSESSILIGKMRGLEIMIHALSRFIDRVNVAAIILNAIWNLCVEQENCEIAIKNNARTVIIKLYERHNQSPVVLLNGSACLLAIITSLDVSINQDNICLMYYLLDSLNNHPGYVNLVKYTLILLESLISMNEEHAMQFLECQGSIVSEYENESVAKYYGLKVIGELYKIHEDNSALILWMCNVILKVVSYEDLVDVMIDLEELITLLNAIVLRFKNSSRLLACISAIRLKLNVQIKYLGIT